MRKSCRKIIVIIRISVSRRDGENVSLTFEGCPTPGENKNLSIAMDGLVRVEEIAISRRRSVASCSNDRYVLKFPEKGEGGEARKRDLPGERD
jgi:hypothetical protein